MNQDSTIMLLWVAVGALAVLAISFFFTAEDHFKRAVQANLIAEQHAANASSQGKRAQMHQRAAEQATDRANLLAAHIAELEAENARLEQRVIYQSSLIRHADVETINRMAVMDAPLKWLPRDCKGELYTINLN